MQVSNGKRGTLFLLLWWFSVLPVPFHSSPVDFGQRAQLNYVANKSLLDLSFLGFLFLPLALRWPENTKLGQEGGVLKKKKRERRSEAELGRGGPPGQKQAGEKEIRHAINTSDALSAHITALICSQGRERLHIKALADLPAVMQPLDAPCIRF